MDKYTRGCPEYDEGRKSVNAAFIRCSKMQILLEDYLIRNSIETDKGVVFFNKAIMKVCYAPKLEYGVSASFEYCPYPDCRNHPTFDAIACDVHFEEYENKKRVICGEKTRMATECDPTEKSLALVVRESTRENAVKLVLFFCGLAPCIDLDFMRVVKNMGRSVENAVNLDENVTHVVAGLVVNEHMKRQVARAIALKKLVVHPSWIEDSKRENEIKHEQNYLLCNFADYGNMDGVRKVFTEQSPFRDVTFSLRKDHEAEEPHVVETLRILGGKIYTSNRASKNGYKLLKRAPKQNTSKNQNLTIITFDDVITAILQYKDVKDVIPGQSSQLAITLPANSIDE